MKISHFKPKQTGFIINSSLQIHQSTNKDKSKLGIQDYTDSIYRNDGVNFIYT